MKERPLYLHTLLKVFPIWTAAVLIATALAKFVSVLNGTSETLGIADPLFGLRFGVLMATAATFELSVAAVCLTRSTVESLMVTGWLSTVFLCYRVGLWWIGWQKPCSCLGNLTDALHISPQLADNVMKGLLAFMLIGSVSLLILHYRQGRVVAASPAQPAPEPGQA